MTIEEILSKEEEFRYQLLSRMKMDCDYALDYGRVDGNHFWAITEMKQIQYMKVIWKSFSENAKPHWLSWEQILQYEKQITVPRIELHPSEAYIMKLRKKQGWSNATITNTHIYRYYSDYWIISSVGIFAFNSLKVELPALQLRLKVGYE